MALSDSEIQEIIRLYVEEKKSTYEIAEMRKTYPNFVRRTLIRAGVELRDHSESQKAALETGRSSNPFEGKSWGPEDRKRISKHMRRYWEDLSDAEREELIEKKKEWWEGLTLDEQRSFTKMGHSALNKAAKEGSHLERHLRDELEKRGYLVIFHRRGQLIAPDLEIDIFLPQEKVCIEVDGRHHYEVVYDTQRFERQLEIDKRKDGLLLQAGYTVVRIKCLFRKISARRKDEALEKLLAVLERLESGEGKNTIIELVIE